MERIWCLFFLSTCVVAQNAQELEDPCTTAYVLDKMDQRYKENIAKDSSAMLCDRFRLGNGRWVRADGQDLLQTEPLPHELCGTRYPIWMKEPPPETVDEKPVDKEACVVGLRGTCEKTLPIKIKKCVGYNVYFLTPPTNCYKAYCFQYSTEDAPPTEVIPQPVVRHNLVRKEDIASQELQFICSFPPDDTDFYYQVVWYIEDKPVVVTEPVKKDSITKTNLGHSVDDPTKGYMKLGINIKCAVRLKLEPEGAPGPLSTPSENFFAGIEVKSTKVNIKRDEPRGQIDIKLTVPFGCPFMPDGSVENCGLDIEMNVPRDPTKCTSDVKAVKAMHLIGQGKYCGFRILNTEWQETIALPISFIDTPEYNLVLPDSPDGAFRIGMITVQNDEKPEWSGIELQDVYVHIADSSDIWQGKKCAAVNDPHMYTFDGRGYENQNKGRFVLYWGKRKDFPMEVQIETTECSKHPGDPPPWMPYCVCAIAVRAGADVFVIDQCPSKPIRIKYMSCKENLLDARKETEKEYKVGDKNF